jgi:hypothetical protein
MRIDITDAATEQSAALDEVQNFQVRSDTDTRQLRQSGQDDRTLAQMTQGQFADDEWMYQDDSGIEQTGQRSVA